MAPSLKDEIRDAYLLMLGARERGDVDVEFVQCERMNRLLARYPHASSEAR